MAHASPGIRHELPREWRRDRDPRRRSPDDAHGDQVGVGEDADRDVRVVIKEFPILGPGSVFAAKAALASAKQGKYREFHTALNRMRGAANQTSVLQVAQEVGLDVAKLQTDMESEEVAEVIGKNKSIARSLSIDGTPTFLFDDTIEPSYASYEVLAQYVATIRRNGGCRFC